MRTFLRALLSVATVVAFANGVAAQNVGQTTDIPPTVSTGWTFSPSIVFGGAWDDNVLLQGRGDNLQSAFTTIVAPQAGIEYSGKRNRLTASYDGSLVLYRQLDGLNSFDQHGGL